MTKTKVCYPCKIGRDKSRGIFFWMDSLLSPFFYPAKGPRLTPLHTQGRGVSLPRINLGQRGESEIPNNRAIPVFSGSPLSCFGVLGFNQKSLDTIKILCVYKLGRAFHVTPKVGVYHFLVGIRGFHGPRCLRRRGKAEYPFQSINQALAQIYAASVS